MPPCWGHLQRYGALVQRYWALWQTYRAMVWKYMALLQRDWAFLRTTPCSVATQVRMAVIMSQLSSFVLSLVRIWDCNTPHHTATHCNTVQNTACRHNSTLRSSCLSSFVMSLVRIWNTFSGASSFIYVTWSFTVKRHTHALIRVTWRDAVTYSYVTCDKWSMHLFIFVTWHALIHVCDMTRAQRRQALTCMTWRQKIFSDASFFLWCLIYNARKLCLCMDASCHEFESVIFIFVTWCICI